MDREETLRKLEEIDITEDDLTSSTAREGAPDERMRVAVAKIKEKRTSTGRVYGVKPEEKERRLTAKQRAFAAYVTQGMSPSEAYRKAYETSTGNDATVLAAANKLMKDKRIAALIGSVFESIKENVVADAIATRRHVMSELFDHSKKAKTESAKLKALELMGRAVGMFTDKIEQKVEDISTDQLKKELESHLSLLNNVTPIKKRSA